MPMHFLGGLLLGLMGIYFLSLFFYIKQKTPIGLILAASLITACFFGCLWELIEFNSEVGLRSNLAETFAIEDTREDIFLTLLVLLLEPCILY